MKGIIVFGASGSGTTTLGRKLAERLGFRHFELDDYYWLTDTDISFTATRPREERIEKLMRDISDRPGFVMSGSICGWSEPFLPLLHLAVFVYAPASVRLERIAERESARFGNRILPGGDMYEKHKSFLAWAAQYDTMDPPERCLKLHEDWVRDLSCPVVRIDGTKDLNENMENIMASCFQ